ncbi:hypothetical protein TURU_035701 [Turdus rufiventris]|nr:hypothetical protein TURU_035701 [Turdus rufiventris]
MHPRVLRELPDIVAKPLSMKFENMTAHEVPSDIFKKGSKEDPEKYGPISLNSVPGTNMEQILLEAARGHAEDKEDIGGGIECTLSKFADNTKLSGVVDKLKGQDAIQRNLDRLEKQAHENLMGFNKTKCKVLHLGQENPWYQHRVGDEQIEKREEKHLGALVDERLGMAQQYAFAAQKAKCVLGYIQSNVASRAREGILPLCSGEIPPAVLHPALESQHRKDMDLLE